MKINGKTVAEEYDLEQWNVEMSYGEVTNESSWEPGCPVPILLESEFGMKKIKLSMLAKGSDRGLIWEKCEKIIAELAKPAVLELEGFNHKYKVVLTNAQQVESSIKRFHKAVLELIGYEFGERRTVTIKPGQNLWLENNGTVYAPLKITVNQNRQYEPKNTIYLYYEDDEITGTSNSVPVGSFLFEGKTERLMFDASNGKTEEKKVNEEKTTAGGLQKIEIFDIPRIKPGGMYFACEQSGGSADTTVTIEYEERYI